MVPVVISFGSGMVGQTSTATAGTAAAVGIAVVVVATATFAATRHIIIANIAGTIHLAVAVAAVSYITAEPNKLIATASANSE